MDETTANLLSFGIFFGLPVICMTLYGIVARILDYKKGKK